MRRKYYRYKDSHCTVANKLGRTVGAITSKAGELWLTDKVRAWSKKELRLIKKLYPNNTAEQVAEQIERPVHGIRRKVVVLGLRKRFDYDDCHRVVNGTKEKLCRKCRNWQDESQFVGDSSSKDGLKIYCKSCDAEAQREYRHKRVKEVREYLRFEERHRKFRGDRQKLCTHCKKWKYENEFYRNRQARDGLHSHCKVCLNKGTVPKQERRVVRRNLHYDERHRVVRSVKQKLCSHCRKWKDESSFYRQNASIDGLSARCKECSKKYAREQYTPKKKRRGCYIKHEKRHRTVNGVREKFCSRCKKWKKKNEFYRARQS